ncbi:MAG: pilus assembly protein PilM [Fibrobacteria bacterium]
MVKRSIQTSNPGVTVGIEYDHLAIRAALLNTDGRGAFSVAKVVEIRGEYGEDRNLLEGFRQVKAKLGLSGRDSVVTCLSGKQVFATQLPFRRLGKEEMEQALRLELRKTVHFEVATSTLDYQILGEDDGSNGGAAQVLVALAATALLNRQLGLLEKAGLKVMAVDVLPVAIANTLWAWKAGGESHHPLIAVHIGPQVSTIVIDGEYSPFFTRNVYFAAEDVFAPNANPVDREKRIQALAEEVSRSVIFYEKNSEVTGFQEVLLLGDHLEGAALMDKLQRQTGLPVQAMDLAGKTGMLRESQPGRFDLAVSLALRGEA